VPPRSANLASLSRALPRAARAELARLRSPLAIQQFLDRISYSTDPVYRSPRQVLEDQRAHCVDGALLAAGALRRLGHPPLVIWIHAVNDDGHMVAPFRRGRYWGSIGKSNVVGLRYREPVYRSVRELMMSYFNDYFNLKGQRTMRSHTRPVNLARYDRLQWETSDANLSRILDVDLDRFPLIPVVPPGAKLSHLDDRSIRAGLLGADDAGLFKPR
jgi:hypothetical protein